MGQRGLAVTGGVSVTVQLRAPALHLATVPIIGSAEVFEAESLIVQPTQGSSGADELLPHAPTPAGIRGIESLQLARRRKTLQGLHRIEVDAHHRAIGTGRQQAWVGHGAACDRRQDTSFSRHGLVAVGAQMTRRATQHEAGVAALHKEQIVLRATGELGDFCHRTTTRQAC
ncbi:hypothetical protein FQZ97_1052630 [compost metagenome]